MFATLQTRQKWNQTNRNYKVGDIVLLRDNIIRNKWAVARILKTYSNEEELVRNVQLVTTKETSIFDRPVNKLVLLVENKL